MGEDSILNDSTFWITMAGIISGILLVVVKQRIRTLSLCWGCLQIHRDTHAEEREAEMQIQRANAPVIDQTPSPTVSDGGLELSRL